AGVAVRRTGLATDRRARPDDPRLSHVVAVALGGRPGEGDADRSGFAQGRAGDPAAARPAGGQRVDAPQARNAGSGARAAALIALPQHTLDALLSRHSMLESELSTKLPTETFVKLSREFSELGPVIEAIKAYRTINAEIADMDALIDDPK